MKRIITTIAMCTLLVGVSEANNAKAGSRGQSASGLFTGTVAGNEYTVEVRCAHLDKDYFQFRSDESDVSDSNGDGLVVSGMETNGKFALTIIDNGKIFSVGNLSEFSKGDNTAEGSGKLFEEGTADAHDVRFSVSCR